MEIFRFSAPPGKYMLELKESQPLLLSLSGIVCIVLGGFCTIGGLISGILSFTG